MPGRTHRNHRRHPRHSPPDCAPAAAVLEYCGPDPSSSSRTRRTRTLMSHLDPALQELADALGIATEFWDWQGHHQPVPADTVTAVLAALDIDTADADGAQTALAEHHRRAWRRMLPPCLVARQGHRPAFPVHVPAGWSVHLWIDLENGGVRDGLHQLPDDTPDREVDGQLDRAGELSSCRMICRWATTPCGPGPATASRPPPSSSRRPGWGFRNGWATAAPGDSPPSSTASGRRSPGASVTSPTSAIWPSGRPPSTARGTSWSTRCTRVSHWRRWSPPPTCRRAAGSPTRSTSAWSASRSTPISTPPPGTR